MPRLPDLEAMAIFAKIVEARGIGAAATDLGLSTPTVSKTLARLEQTLGARLFNRTPHRLTLTEAGRLLAEHATRLLADAEAAQASLLTQSTTPTGLVRLAVPMSFGVRQVAPLLPAFLARHSGISIDLHLNDAVIDIVGEGFDLALRIGEIPETAMLVRRLAGVERVIIAAPSYLHRRGRPSHPTELARHDCFGYAYLRTGDIWPFHNDKGQELCIRLTGRLRVNNGEAILPAVIAGLGIAFLPRFLAQEALAAGQLEAIMPEWSTSQAGLYLLMPPQGPQPARVRLLADFLAEQLARSCENR